MPAWMQGTTWVIKTEITMSTPRKTERRNGTVNDRFWAKVNKTEGCWEWTACVDHFGYGRMNIGKGAVQASHRISWRLHFGEIPDAMYVLHKCDNPLCVNPNHLFLGTHSDNRIDMYKKGRGMDAKVKARGEKHGMAKLKVPDVLAIRSDTRSSKAISLDYNISADTVNKIKRKRNWAHV